MQLGQAVQAAISAAWRACRHVPLASVTVIAALGQWVGLLGSDALGVSVAALFALILVTGMRRRFPMVVLAAVCGGVALWHGYGARQAILPEVLLNVPLEIEGRVLSLRVSPASTAKEERQSLIFAVDQCQVSSHVLSQRFSHAQFQGLSQVPSQALSSRAGSCSSVDKIQLFAGAQPRLAVGERWRLRVKLKPPHGVANPDQWDTVWRVRRQGIGAVGRVMTQGTAERLSAARWQPSAWLRQQVIRSAISPQAQRWLIGMIIGDGSAFDESDWQLFNDTGITHLAVVSGSHVTLAVGFWAMLLQ